ncbi:MAG: nucleoside recognition domain-containing protein [Bacillota bacterium]|jgi:spore maturation protein A|nr:nucleoside recognition domain-containing protein [Bacillota bacterium]HHT89792.1 spore maturation protein [Bacillota bacterium]
MINYVWFCMILAGVITSASKGQIHLVTEGILKGSEQAVVVSIGLVGIISFWSGMMKIAQDAGLMKTTARILGPLARRLFPDVPVHHRAMGSLLLAMSANLLGLGNACTPLGLRAMGDLQELNKDKERASDAMCTFMAVTSSSLTVIPTTIIALRLTHGSATPTDIIGPIIVATTCSTLAAIAVDRILRKFS